MLLGQRLTARRFAEMGSRPMGRVRGVWLGAVHFRTLSICSFEQISKQNTIGETLSSGLNDTSKYLAFKLPLERHVEGGLFR